MLFFNKKNTFFFIIYFKIYHLTIKNVLFIHFIILLMSQIDDIILIIILVFNRYFNLNFIFLTFLTYFLLVWIILLLNCFIITIIIFFTTSILFNTNLGFLNKTFNHLFLLRLLNIWIIANNKLVGFYTSHWIIIIFYSILRYLEIIFHTIFYYSIRIFNWILINFNLKRIIFWFYLIISIKLILCL